MKSYFYPRSIYTVVAAFSEMFTGMSTRVYSKDGEIVGAKPVACGLQPKEKIAAILQKGSVNDVDPQVDNYLPRISIVNSGINWAPDRQAGKYDKRLLNVEYETDKGKRVKQTDLNPIPYDLTFEVSVWAKYAEDGYQIVENILPFFAPQVFISYKERNFGLEHKAKVTMQGVNQNHFYEYGENERRILQWNFTFIVEATMFKPMELTPDILCSRITINNVPCRKVPFEGSKLIIYEPESDVVSNEFAVLPKIKGFDFDDVDGYNQMIKFWKEANEAMVPGYQQCVDNSCGDVTPPEPVYDSTTPGISSCQGPVLKNPRVIVDQETKIISHYWQEFMNENNIVSIISLLQHFTGDGLPIGSVQLIPNESYPD